MLAEFAIITRGQFWPPKAILSPVDPQQSATTEAAPYQENTYYSNVAQSKNSMASSTKQILWLPSLSVYVP